MLIRLWKELDGHLKLKLWGKGVEPDVLIGAGDFDWAIGGLNDVDFGGGERLRDGGCGGGGSQGCDGDEEGLGLLAVDEREEMGVLTLVKCIFEEVRLD